MQSLGLFQLAARRFATRGNCFANACGRHSVGNESSQCRVAGRSTSAGCALRRPTQSDWSLDVAPCGTCASVLMCAPWATSVSGKATECFGRYMEGTVCCLAHYARCVFAQSHVESLGHRAARFNSQASPRSRGYLAGDPVGDRPSNCSLQHISIYDLTLQGRVRTMTGLEQQTVGQRPDYHYRFNAFCKLARNRVRAPPICAQNCSHPEATSDGELKASVC